MKIVHGAKKFVKLPLSTESLDIQIVNKDYPIDLISPSASLISASNCSSFQPSSSAINSATFKLKLFNEFLTT